VAKKPIRAFFRNITGYFKTALLNRIEKLENELKISQNSLRDTSDLFRKTLDQLAEAKIEIDFMRHLLVTQNGCRFYLVEPTVLNSALITISEDKEGLRIEINIPRKGISVGLLTCQIKGRSLTITKLRLDYKNCSEETGQGLLKVLIKIARSLNLNRIEGITEETPNVPFEKMIYFLIRSGFELPIQPLANPSNFIYKIVH
jgi:hypothetical protein